MPALKPRIFESVGCLIALAAALFVAGSFPQAKDQANVALGAIALVYGTWAFAVHGGARITALGLFNFAFALFIGYGGIAEGLNPVRRTSPGYVALAISAALVAQILVNLVAWRRAAPADEPVTMPPPSVAARATWLGGIGTLVVFAADRLVPALSASPLLDGAVFTSVVLLAVGLLFRVDTSLVSLRTALVLLALGLYAEVFHQGSGRLRLVALACVIGLLLTARFPRRSVKMAALVVTPIAIWWLAQYRLDVQESIQAGNSAGHTGLESMTTPILLLAQIIRAISGTGTVDPSWGQSFLSVPFIVVPQSLQPDWVPDAIGYQLVALVSPNKLGSGFSVAGTVYGEAYWNGTWIGVLLSIPLLGWLLAVLDSRFRRALAELAAQPRALVRVVFWAMLAGSNADLVWNGTHVWIARDLARLPVLVLLAALVWITTRPRARPAPLWAMEPHRLPQILRERVDRSS